MYAGKPGEKVTESSPKKEGFANGPRFEILLSALKSPHVHAVGFLPPIVLGEDMGRWGSAFFQYINLNDQGPGSATVDLFGDPLRRMAAIHVRDLAAAYVLAAENITQASGQEFLLAPDVVPHTWEEVQRRVAEIMGADSAKVTVKVREPATDVEKFRNFHST